MRKENGEISIPEITQDVEVNGVLLSHSTVRGEATLHLNGVAAHGLTVDAGGRAIINGSVIGSVANDGGRVEVRGVVQGPIHNTGGGHVTIHRHAVVDGRPASSTFDL